MSAALAYPSVSSTAKKQVEVELLYLDLDACTRCRGTEANLETALAAVGDALAAAGVEKIVRKTHVASAAQAAKLGFASSPTIRVNGQDIALELRESSCDSGDEDCGCGGTIDCRVWVWQGEEYTVAPVPMIVDAVLGEIYGGRARPALASGQMASPAPAAEVASCCAPAEQASCCEPAAKASCCGDAAAGNCGCR